MWEIKSCSKSDDCYPKHLRKIASAPERLYYVGDISLCDNVVVAVMEDDLSGGEMVEISIDRHFVRWNIWLDEYKK